ncbi:hypothetical protein GDO81_014607 [Engystomops pustulosus]|uniref:Uncharacterized protein n=1 Tax=Engystomops pustulosus TaxID=76066 RepID=A0AAV7BC43_ENGPU|nr:hypothetical protein GDO81_014607 [Engystomops pustulosus]
MENPSFLEVYPTKSGEQPPPYNPGQSFMQPCPQAPNYPTGPGWTTQQTLIFQPTSTNVGVNEDRALTQPPHSDYLCWSIVNLLFCCWPIGIAAIVYSCRTRDNIDAYNHEAAARNSRTAFNLNVSALVIGLIINVIFAVLIFSRR